MSGYIYTAVSYCKQLSLIFFVTASLNEPNSLFVKLTNISPAIISIKATVPQMKAAVLQWETEKETGEEQENVIITLIVKMTGVFFVVFC